MVTHWGMSDRLGPMSFRIGEEHVFLGKEIQEPRDFSEETAAVIDEEVRSCSARPTSKPTSCSRPTATSWTPGRGIAHQGRTAKRRNRQDLRPEICTPRSNAGRNLRADFERDAGRADDELISFSVRKSGCALGAMFTRYSG